ncbi:MAG TPA: TonB-dependent receptor [Pyrinomonadaceae bacterium]|nr:TonB-dependent receptor [Pyrinomonadaceae bacterium]
MEVKLFRSFLLCLGVMAIATLAFGQAATGRLSGTVSGPDGLIANATVVVTDNQTKQSKTVMTNDQGAFSFPQLAVGTYTATFSATGFKTLSATAVRIDVGKEYVLTPTLEVGAIEEQVNVFEGADVVNSSNAELSNTVTETQMLGLPINGRDPSSLIQLQPGASQGGEINGQRTSAMNVTRDGLNVQDNFIRTGNFNPDRPRIDDVSEFTVVTQNANPSLGSGGTSQVQYVTSRGGVDFHGALWEYNQNAALASNGFFNNRNGVEKPPFNQNQFGGKVSGPIWPIRKAFFFFDYEGLRLPQTTSANRTILTPSARQGIFTYVDDDGNTRQFDVLGSQGLSINPLISSRILSGIPAAGNNNQIGDGLNTTGFTFNQRADVKINLSTTRIDYDISQKKTVNFVWHRTTDNFLRPDTDTGGFNTTPFGSQTATTNELVGAFNWSIGNRLNNEVRGGYQKSNPFFNTSGLPSDFFISLPLTDSPENSFISQGRTTKLYNLQDNAVYLWRNHSFRFGGQDNIYRIVSFGGSTLPTYFLDNSNFPNFGFVPAGTPGVPSSFTIPDLSDPNQVATANALQSELAGLVGESQNTFNVTSRTSGFVPGAPVINTLNYNNLSFYVADQWRVRPNLTLNLGVRYELFSGIKDPSGLRLEVVTAGMDPNAALLNPNGTFDFVGGNAGSAGQFFKSDKNNFAPNISFAWSPHFRSGLSHMLFGDSGTVIRGGFSESYINDEFVRSPDNALQNQGLSVTPVNFGLTSLINNAPPIPVPAFVSPPLTFSSINALAPGANVAFLIDPNMQLPRVEQYNFGIQREIGFKSVLEIRYVGNRSHELIRTVDLNQVDIRNNGFLPDYIRARSNLLLTGNPACTPLQNAGCQTLTVFPQLANGGSLNSAAVRNLLLNGSVADLARRYVTLGQTGSVQILPNPNMGILDLLGNLGESNYNALQVELRRRFSGGLLLQANYTFQKTLDNISPGNPGINSEDQTRVAAFLDNQNQHLDYGRADYDQTHVFNLNAVYDLPFGKGKSFLNGGSGAVDRLVGGWQLGGILRINTGTPLTIVDPRGTLNRVGRAANQTAVTDLTNAQISDLIGIFNQNGIVYYINPSVINSDGRGAAAFGQPAFPNEVFFDNGPGQFGTLARSTINGPLFTQLDMSLTKSIRINERMRFQIRADAFNVLNHTNFLTGILTPGLNLNGTSNTIFNVNSPTFGQITSANTIGGSGLNRIIQVAGRFEF